MARYYVNIAGLATDSELETALGPLEEAIAAEAIARQTAIQQLEDAMIAPLTQATATATNGTANVTIAAVPGQRHIIETIIASYSAKPTGGAVAITGAWSLPITEAGPAPLTGLRIAGETGESLTVTLAAGGSGVTGTLVVGYRTEAGGQ